MGDIAAIALIMMASIAVGLGSAAVMLYIVFKKRFVQPVEVFEKEKKKTFIVPDGGVYVIKDKRKVKIQDDAKAWFDEQDRRLNSSLVFMWGCIGCCGQIDP